MIIKGGINVYFWRKKNKDDLYKYLGEKYSDIKSRVSFLNKNKQLYNVLRFEIDDACIFNCESINLDYIQDLALDMMPEFVNENELDIFVDESEKNYKESTFKKFIHNYSDFLNHVESEFYSSLLFSLAE